jgi:hypothetical protein
MVPQGRRDDTKTIADADYGADSTGTFNAMTHIEGRTGRLEMR